MPLEEKQETPEPEEGQAEKDAEGEWCPHSKDGRPQEKTNPPTPSSGNFLPPGPSLWQQLETFSCYVLSHFSHVRLFWTPWTVACQAPLSMGILQARILEWVAMSSSRGSSQPRIETRSSVLQADSLPSEPPGKPYYLSSLIICIVILYALNFYRKYSKEKKHSKYSNSFLKEHFHCIIQNYLYKASHGNI